VLTPMAWGFFGRIGEVNCRRGFADLGLLPRSAVAYPDSVGERMFGIFCGRMALNAPVMRKIMCALPGVKGDEVERDILGYVPEGVRDEPYPWRGSVVAVKAPPQLLKAGRETASLRSSSQVWWQSRVGPAGPSAGVDPRELLSEAMKRFGVAMVLQAKTRMVFQGASSQLLLLAERAGAAQSAGSLLAGVAGLEEASVADDLWQVAQDRLPIEQFVARHGFHGPNSGNITSRSWREDPGPVHRLLDALRAGEEPAARRTRTRAAAAQAVEEVLSRLPAGARVAAHVTLRLAPRAARNLERTKTAYLIALDVARAATRAIGDQLVTEGWLDDREDAFFLLPDDVVDGQPGTFRELVAIRREAHERYLATELPETWTGQPKTSPVSEGSDASEVREVHGAGVSAGVAEGRVRVILDPAVDATIELGDVLVAPITDPSWVSLMTVAGALVIDTGTAASHSAIVARELGVPCVIGTKTGTRELRDGDRVRVDGSRGIVEVIKRDIPHPQEVT
jgi:phosphohistidine swiveling domain-containing protein